jgi:hypothetical protein
MRRHAAPPPATTRERRPKDRGWLSRSLGKVSDVAFFAWWLISGMPEEQAGMSVCAVLVCFCAGVYRCGCERVHTHLNKELGPPCLGVTQRRERTHTRTQHKVWRGGADGSRCPRYFSPARGRATGTETTRPGSPPQSPRSTQAAPALLRTRRTAGSYLCRRVK